MKIICYLLLALSLNVFAEQKLNPATGKFETVRPENKLKYNYMQEEWKHVPPDSKIQYNHLPDR